MSVLFFFCLISKYLNECEESMSQASKISRKYEEFLTELSGFLDTNIREKEKPQEHLTSKVIMCRQWFLYSDLTEEYLVVKEIKQVMKTGIFVLSNDLQTVLSFKTGFSSILG